MSHFWRGLFDHLKDCGRHGMLFLAGLAGFAFLLAAVAIVHTTGLDEYLVRALPAIILLLVTWLCVVIRRWRARRRERLPRSRLSCDELRVARSKLVKRRSVKGL